jgi:hypothetical protein
VKPPKTLADVDLGELSEQMRATVEQAKANDPKALKVEIARMKKELEAARVPKIQAAPAPPRLPKRVEVPALTPRQEKKIDALMKVVVELRVGYEESVGKLKKEHDAVVAKADAAIAASAELRKRLRELASGKTSGVVVVAPRQPPQPSASRRPEIPKRAAPQGLENGEIKLGKGQRACLIAIAQHGNEGVTKKQLRQITGYTRRTCDQYLSVLREVDFIYEGGGNRIVATEPSVVWLGGDYEELPTGDALYRHLLSKLPQGEGRVLQLLHDAHPEAVDRSAIDEALGYTRRTRDQYLLNLKNRRVV